MKIRFVALLFITIYNIVFNLNFKKTVKQNIIKQDNKVHMLYNHGCKTLKNSILNVNMILVNYWMLFVIFYDLEFFFGPYRLWLIMFILSSSSYLYKISEIKHLADGISKSKQSDMFFIKFSLYGFFGIITDFVILITLNIELHYKLISLFTVLLLFILGMGDLLQVRNINKYGGFKKDLMESIYLLIDAPTQILKVIIFTKHRNAFIKTLKINLINIKRGLKKAIKSYAVL